MNDMKQTIEPRTNAPAAQLKKRKSVRHKIIKKDGEYE